jgi:hypothetical protein
MRQIHSAIRSASLAETRSLLAGPMTNHEDNAPDNFTVFEGLIHDCVLMSADSKPMGKFWHRRRSGTHDRPFPAVSAGMPN